MDTQFQLYFDELQRFTAWGIEGAVAWTSRLRARIANGVPEMVWWARFLTITPLWLSFEGYQFLWSYCESWINRRPGKKLSAWHRLVFCAALSILAGQWITPAVWQRTIGFGTVLVWAAHGFVVHLYWRKGSRWCKQQLGIRPLRSIDPQNPFANLDLGS